jgi:hypothetical protein
MTLINGNTFALKVRKLLTILDRVYHVAQDFLVQRSCMSVHVEDTINSIVQGLSLPYLQDLAVGTPSLACYFTPFLLYHF